jgi:RNA polymerase sigma factor (sigma-70 family)
MKGKQDILPDYRRLLDEELVRRYAERGEQGAVFTLFERYSHIVLGICFNHYSNSQLAKEAMQKIFIKMLDDMRSVQPDKFKPWLLKSINNYIAWNSTNTVPVKQNRIISHSQLEFEEVDSRYEDDNVAELVYTVIQRLDRDQKECIELFYFNRKDHVLIANATGHTPEQVKGYIQKGKIFIKHKVQEALRHVRP